ncbi:aspartyl-phosphate phosphatase Spo0E family protein [Ureibacillus sp. FSL K6-8385]|uniref:aspartyl-phosphate phosphatase Spo0E family protein n=1 Tax=Ureibacillus sp. FSL K6-8385 TaxID=2954684 RepID=UPI003158A0C6
MEKLLTQLEHVREKMIRSGLENGLQSPKTLRLSRELDQIINQYVQKSRLFIAKK